MRTPKTVLVTPLSEVSFRSYLIQALIDWCESQGNTPYACVSVDDSCELPREYVDEDNTIVFCISSEATNQFELSESEMSFQARFGNDHVYNIRIPLGRIMAIYPKEDLAMVSYFPVLETKLEESQGKWSENFIPKFTKL